MRRRTLLAGLAASATAPAWAATGATHIAAAREPSGAYALFGLAMDATTVFRVPLPARGHAAAAHPMRSEAVAFARRPGTFALVLDCAGGTVTHRLTPPSRNRFQGHGAYTADGVYLLTTEAVHTTSEGRIGIWDSATWTRVDEIPSGGLGPHEILRLPSGGFAIANGGIRTDPSDGRRKMNLDTMRPNLTYLDNGRITETVALPGLAQASIRHLAAHGSTIAVALQWEGSPDRTVPLLMLHQRGQAPRLFEAGPDQPRMQGYAGSVAFSGNGQQCAITGPRGGLAPVFDVATGAVAKIMTRPDICGVAPAGPGLAFSDGTGGLLMPNGVRKHALAWDNHLIALAPTPSAASRSRRRRYRSERR
ncbi:hypothetical protein JANAI62_36610 [Jannaschia pagri]|uniref:DUF1513 domain-containing protein n=2 Tax=Roseobacteraceae TaxID=2854170 RepID=A0ABQ4NRP5_9RHOB|nr:hypothetical protein JANAI61_36530 [Jannaschia sp. AI_61]GIT97038.1 hypothetical protein JANAI62_36610 [Jannaschia sp. AI_62]